MIIEFLVGAIVMVAGLTAMWGIQFIFWIVYEQFRKALPQLEEPPNERVLRVAIGVVFVGIIFVVPYMIGYSILNQ